MHLRNLLSLAVIAVLGCGTATQKGVPKKPAPKIKTGTEIQEKVKREIAQLLEIEAGSIDITRPLTQPPMNADDLDIVEIIMMIEDAFEIEISDELIKERTNQAKDPFQELTPKMLMDIVRAQKKAKQQKP